MTGTAEYEAVELTKGQRDTLRTQLNEDLAQTESFVGRLRNDLESMRSSRLDVSTDDEHDPEGPTMAFERSQSVALLADMQSHLDNIGAALTRLDEGTFGACAGCGQPIPFARLEARPYTPYCVSCAARLGG
jgi:DnaK suppressor protein